MAKRRRRKKTTHHATKRKTLSVGTHHKRRRRRRHGMGDGGMMKLLSNPYVGGLVGGLGAYLSSRFGANVLRDKKTNEPSILGAIAFPGGLALLSGKKLPFVTAGVVAGTSMGMVDVFVKKQPPDSVIHKFLGEVLGEDVHFVNDTVLSERSDKAIILSADGTTEIPYSLKDVLLAELEDSYYGGGMNDMDDDN